MWQWPICNNVGHVKWMVFSGLRIMCTCDWSGTQWAVRYRPKMWSCHNKTCFIGVWWIISEKISFCFLGSARNWQFCMLSSQKVLKLQICQLESCSSSWSRGIKVSCKGKNAGTVCVVFRNMLRGYRPIFLHLHKDHETFAMLKEQLDAWKYKIVNKTIPFSVFIDRQRLDIMHSAVVGVCLSDLFQSCLWVPYKEKGRCDST